MATTTNIPINARSMNGIIVLSDGIATIENGDLTTTGDITSNTISSNSLTANDLDLNGSLTLEQYNDIPVSTTGGSQLVSLYEKGKSYFEQDVYMNRAYSYNTPTTGYEIANKDYVDVRTPIYAEYSSATNMPSSNLSPNNIGLQWVSADYTIMLPNVTLITIGNTYRFFMKTPLGFGQTISIKGKLANQYIQVGNTVTQYVYITQFVTSVTLVCISNTVSTTVPVWALFDYNYDYENVFRTNTISGTQNNYVRNYWNEVNYFSKGGIALSVSSGSYLELLGTLQVNSENISPVELSYLLGVTSPIQSQLDLCVTTAGDNTFTGTNTFENQVTLQTNANFNFTSPQIAPTILNQYFALPTQTNNSFTLYASPYTAVIATGWNVVTASPTYVFIAICRNITAYNSSRVFFPIPSRNTYLAFQFSSSPTPASVTISQDITFPSTGDYLLTYYANGTTNNYSGATETLNASISGTNQNAILTETVWCLQKMLFRVTDISAPITLTFTCSTTATTIRRVCIYGVIITKCVGVNVSDGGIINNQLLESTGINTRNIFNQTGNFINYGRTLLFGGLELYARYAPSTTLLNDSTYGTLPTTTGGRVIAIGNSNILSGLHLQDVISIGVETCQNVGVGTGTNASFLGANSSIIAIGYACLRAFNGLASTGSFSLHNIFIGYECGRNITIPTGSVTYNACIGTGVLNRPLSTNIQYNALFGHNIMGTSASATSTIQYNSVFGNDSFKLARGANNTSVGYNNFNLATNTASNNNCFFGANVCNTQSGTANILQNCSFIGSNSDVSSAGNYSNSTCLGYNSRITGNNQLILGTASEVTYPMGGLNIPVATVLTLLGNILANSLTVTPVQLSFLNQVSANQIPTSAISGYGTGFLTTSSNATITGTYTFTTNPVLNSGALPVSAIQDMATRIPSLSSACSFFGNLAGDAQITTTTTGIHNSGFGTGALKDNDAGSYNTAVGSKAGFAHDAGDYCSYFGYSAGGANTASNVTIIGADSCTTQTSIPNATVIGEGNSVADGNTNAVILGQGNTISGNNCGIIGYGITNNVADRIHIGNATQTVYIQNDLIVNDELQPTTILYKKYYQSMVNPTTLLNGNTIAPPLYEFNKVNIGAGNLFLPLSSEVEVGTVLQFRRVTTVSGNLTISIQTGSGQAILGRNSVTPVTVTTLINVAVYVSIIYLETNLWAILA